MGSSAEQNQEGFSCPVRLAFDQKRSSFMTLAAILTRICHRVASVTVLRRASGPQSCTGSTSRRDDTAVGSGIHRCVGDRIAEQQLRILWEEILERDLRMEIAGPPQRIYSNFIREFHALPARIVN